MRIKVDDYISRTKLKECIELIAAMHGGVHVADILNLIDKAPEADVATVRYTKIRNGECVKCGWYGDYVLRCNEETDGA